MAGAAAGIALLGAGCGDGGNSALDPPDPAGGAATSTLPPPSGAGVPTTDAPPVERAEFVARGPDTASRVALTFHTDGDLGLAAELLDALSARHVPMTAFVVGQWLDANPRWADRLTDAGHELANHTYTHPSFATLGPAAMTDEIVRTRDLLVRLTGKPGRYFRPSGTADGTTRPSDAVLDATGAAGYRVALGFDVDPLDYQSPGASVVAPRVLAGVRPGSVVSLHFGYPGTVAALPTILDGLAARNLTPVTVSTLLGAS